MMAKYRNSTEWRQSLRYKRIVAVATERHRREEAAANKRGYKRIAREFFGTILFYAMVALAIHLLAGA